MKVSWEQQNGIVWKRKQRGYIHGFTENYVKVKAPWNPELVNTLHEINLTKLMMAVCESNLLRL
jgi:hypothetical protein